MAHPKTIVQILDNDLNVVAELLRFHPLNKEGMILRYSKELSDWGTCLFRISTKDPILTQFGDILVPHQYHIRIKRGGTIVWAGAIVDNSDRNKLYVEVRGAEYEFYLNKILIHRDAIVTAGDGKENYATFSSGTMSSAITTMINNAVADFSATSAMKNLTIGTIENPNYPAGFQDASGVALTGAWSFSSFITLQFDYTTAYYALKAFGVYTKCDFEVTSDMVFNFQKFIGSKTNNVTFRYGTQGNIVDYSIPRRGTDMVNDLWGIAADQYGVVLAVEQPDSVSQDTFGLMQGVQGYTDVKDKNFLKARTNASLVLLKDPNVSTLSVVLDERGYPLGQYGIGDLVRTIIKDHVIDFNQTMRIVGITVNLHETGRELTTVQQNLPDPADVGSN